MRYEPLPVKGSKVNHVIALLHGVVATIVPRFTLSLKDDWADTFFALPSGNWRNAFTGETFSGKISLAALLHKFPLPLLVRGE